MEHQPRALLTAGLRLLEQFCAQNALVVPEVREAHPKRWRFSACAYYRPVYIAICLRRCASPGYGGRAWSWPGYAIDRTPYGVLAHELGHHVDYHFSGIRGAYYGDFSKNLRAQVDEPKLTGYCPNDAEWFAEMFRLFVTNSDLLQQLRPKTYAALCEHLVPIITVDWKAALVEAPQRIINQAANKILEAAPLRARMTSEK